MSRSKNYVVNVHCTINIVILFLSES